MKKYILPILVCLYTICFCSCNHDIANYYFEKGVEHYDNEQYEEAIKYYNKAIYFAPEDGAGYINRGLANLCLELNEKALADFEKGYQLDSLDMLANFLIAVTLSEIYGKNEEAIDYFDRVTKYFPYYYSAYYGSGVSRYEIGDYKGALEQFRKYLCYDTTKNSWVYYYIGMCYKQLGDIEKAKEKLNKAIELGNEKAKDELDNVQ